MLETLLKSARKCAKPKNAGAEPFSLSLSVIFSSGCVQAASKRFYFFLGILVKWSCQQV